ncbi:MAG: hypothetical protein ABI597_03395 [Gammaproteobacteria bacterium]
MPNAVLNPSSIRNPILIILVTWIAYLLILGLLQLFNLKAGFAVWPMREDLNWFGFIHNSQGLEMIHEFWKTDGRNPLSAWWWLAISPILNLSIYGLYAVRTCMNPLLAIVVFLLLDRLGRQECRLFALSVALVVLMWNFFLLHEQIIWCFLVAAIFSLLAILFYCQYVDDKSHSPYKFALALLCYFLAIATYTLQSGAIFAIALLGFFRRSREIENKKLRVKYMLYDVSFFLGLFILYNMIWYTTMVLGTEIYSLDRQVFGKQFFQSILQFIFPSSSYEVYFQSVMTDWSFMGASGFLLISFFVFYFLFIKISTNNKIYQAIHFPLGWVVMILLAFALPIIALESTSHIFSPGMRSPMVQQVWLPLLYVGIIFFCVNRLPIKNQQRKQHIVFSLVAVLAGITTLVAIDYNHRLVDITEHRALLVKRINELNLPASPHILLMMTGYDKTAIRSVLPLNNYIKTGLLPGVASIHFITEKALNTDLSEEIVLGPDGKGILFRKLDGTVTRDSYKHLLFIVFDGKKAWIPATLTKKDFFGTTVNWQRDQLIDQSRLYAFSCPSRFDFSMPLQEKSGWGISEKEKTGKSFVWMVSKQAKLSLESSCRNLVKIRVHILDVMNANILNGLTMKVESMPVSLHRNTNKQREIVLEGEADLKTPRNKLIEIAFSVPYTKTPQSGDRSLAVAMDQIEIDNVVHSQS